jgi:hypothetical protein
LSASSLPQNQEIFRHSTPKLSLLLADLALITTDRARTIRPAVLNAVALADQMIITRSSDIGLIGYLYVLEGSHNGGVFLKNLFADSLGVPKNKISYFGCYGDQTRATWSHFVSKLDALSLTEEERRTIEISAVAAFAGLEKIQLSLLPFSEESLRHNVTSINPEAGSHEMPEDPVEIDVALRAGLRTWKQFPYLEQRFGDRGKRFTASDSCWLLSLITLEYNSIKKNIEWLRAVLSSRGIPSLILAKHMQELSTEFEMAIPSRAGTTENFRRVTSELTSERLKYLPQADYKKITAIYQADLNSISGDLDPLSLLISARVDELSGVEGAYEVTRAWFASLQNLGTQGQKLLSDLSLLLLDPTQEIGT